jgi:hypothetical protein
MANVTPSAISALTMGSDGMPPSTHMLGSEVATGYEQALGFAGYGASGDKKKVLYNMPGVMHSEMSTGATSGGRTYGMNGGGGAVSIPNWGSVNSGGARANFKTLYNASHTVGRGFKKFDDFTQKVTAANQMNTLASLNKQKAGLQQTIANNQQQARQTNQTYANNYMGLNIDPWNGNILPQPYHPLMPQQPVGVGAPAPLGNANPNNYLANRPVLQAQQPAQQAAKQKPAKQQQAQKPVKQQPAKQKPAKQAKAPKNQTP